MSARAWIVASTLFIAAATAAHAHSESPIGFYIGDPAPVSAQPAYESFVDVVGERPTSTSLFIDYREPIWCPGTYDAKWRNNANWAAGNLASLVSADHLNLLDENGHSTFVPVVAVGLTDDPTVFQLNLPTDDPRYGQYSEAAAVAMMTDVASGKYDLDDPMTSRRRVWPDIFDAFRTKGFNKIYLRIGWEQNGNWYGWQVRSEATKNAYLAAWCHVADLAHQYAASYGMTIRTVWSPSASHSNYGITEEESYPGDAYVDVIAPTAYSPIWNPTRSRDKTAYYDWGTQQDVRLDVWLANPVNRRQLWDYPSADYWNPTRGWGIPAAIAFAQSRGKPFGLSETGTGNFGVTRRGGGPIDEADYPTYLAERLSPAIAEGLQLEFVDIWAVASGSDGEHFLSGSRPGEAAAWKNFAAIITAATAKENLAQGRRAYASSNAGSSYSPAKAFDAQTSTSWRSTSGDKHWIYVDLGQRYTISRVRLTWDDGFAADYQIQTLVSGTAWTNIHFAKDANGGVDDIAGLSGSGRYVRIFATRRGSSAQYYSLQEVEIFP